jgi:hypothetical protein
MTTDDVATPPPNDPVSTIPAVPTEPSLDLQQERKFNRLEGQLETAMEKWEGKKKNYSKMEVVIDGLLMELSSIPYFGSIPRIVRDERAKGHEAVILALYHHARALILEARNDFLLPLDDVNKIIEAIKKAS